jgi:hypothetical protein
MAIVLLVPGSSSICVPPTYGYIALALVKCSNDGGPGPRHNMKKDPEPVFVYLI